MDQFEHLARLTGQRRVLFHEQMHFVISQANIIIVCSRVNNIQNPLLNGIGFQIKPAVIADSV